MTQIVTVKWATAANGDWTSGAAWTPSGVPNDTAAFDYFAYIGGKYSVGTSAFTVTSSANETIGFLEIGANATLAINGGVFSVASFLHPTSAIFNYGNLDVAAGAKLSVGSATGTGSSGLWNSGATTIAGTLQINAPYFNLHGPGTFTLTGSIIGGATGGENLINHGGNISGSGLIGGGNLYIVNGQGGVFDANGAGALTLNTGANAISNHGTIETFGAGGLVIDSAMQHDGQLMAMGAGALKIVGAEVQGGGALTIANGGSVVLNAGQLSLGGVVNIALGGALTTTTGDLGAVGSGNAYVGDVLSAGDVVDGGKIIVADHSVLNVNASLYGTGQLDLNAATGATTLEIFGTGASLYQSGGVVMSNNASNSIVGNGAAVQINNNTTISGAGVIGDGWLRLVNSVLGKIVSNGTAGLTIVGDVNTVSGGGKENFNGGSISNTGAGGLKFSGGTLSNSGLLIENGASAMTFDRFNVDNGGGVVELLSGHLTLSGNSGIANQQLVTLSATAVLSTTAGDAADTLASNVTNAGQVVVTGGSTLQASGHWTNNKQIAVGSATTAATLSIQSGSRLQFLGAGGTVQMSNAGDKVVSAGAGAVLDNRSDLISGGGTIGDANMTVNNDVGGTIDATVAGGLTLNATAESAGTTFLYNAGTIKADTAAGVTIAAGMYSPGKLIADAGSKIVAQSDVLGLGSATINGAASIEFGAVANNDVYFGAATGGGLILDHSALFTGDVFGLKKGESIDLRDFHFVSGQTGIDAAQSVFGDAAASIVLTNGTSFSATLHLDGAYVRKAFQVVADSSGGTLLKL